MSTATTGFLAPETELPEAKRKLLFWACFVALIATAFGFVIRSLILDDLGRAFNMTAVQKGQIAGVGLWPFAISIILFSLVIDRIGYGKAMVFAFACHVISAIMTITATSYSQLWWATFIVALANGTVEAVINPVVATLFPREKTKWLNILHAGWPGGMVLGGILTIALGTADWKMKVGLILIPTAIYGLLMLGCRFPVNERVAAGVSYRDMLREFGFIGALIASFLVVSEIGRVFSFPTALTWALIIWLTVAFGAYVGFAPGRGIFLVLVLIMIPLATTELGVDSWVTSLMTPEMERLGVAAGWILVYTAAIMTILRFCAGPIIHKLSPLGLLATCSGIAMVGLFALSKATGTTILLAATLYGIGKTFFWPTMLGVVSEQFPRGGAMTLNGISGVGMLGVGIVGAVLLGFIQDTSVERSLAAQHQALHQQVVVEKRWVFGTYKAVDPEKAKGLSKSDQQTITAVEGQAKKEALSTVAVFPLLMLLSYLGLIAYYKARGGYQAVHLTAEPSSGEA